MLGEVSYYEMSVPAMTLGLVRLHPREKYMA